MNIIKKIIKYDEFKHSLPDQMLFGHRNFEAFCQSFIQIKLSNTSFFELGFEFEQNPTICTKVDFEATSELEVLVNHVL